MFGRLGRLLDNVAKLNIDLIFVKLVLDDYVQEYIIGLNVHDQIFRDGVNSNGDRIISNNPTPEGYSVYTIYEREEDELNQEAKSKNGKKWGVEGYNLNPDGSLSPFSSVKSLSPSDRYILLETGRFYDSFEVKVDSGGFTISAETDRGDFNIISSYGKVVGLNEKSKSELAEAIIPLVVKEVRNILLS